MNPFQTQQQIRNNASEMTDYLSDLKQWKNDMDKKEKNTKNNDSKKQPDNLPPIRNQKIAQKQLKQNEELALKYKNEGNNHFKLKKYDLAIESYTKAIKATPENAVLYSNRAMAKLKKNDFAGSESDCCECLELDSSIIKAWFRRGLARKHLKKYNQSLQDFKTVIKMDSNNKPAKKEIKEINNKLQAMYKKSKQKRQINKSNKKKNSNMRRIVIEECDDSDSSDDDDDDDDDKFDGNEKEEKQTKKRQSVPPKKEEIVIEKSEISEKFEMNHIPKNFIEFEKVWSRAKSKENRSLILLALKNKNINKIIKNMIDDTLFSELIQTIHYISTQQNIKDSLIILKQLSKMDRIEMLCPFMDEKDQTLLNQIKQKCSDNKLDTSVFDKFT